MYMCRKVHGSNKLTVDEIFHCVRRGFFFFKHTAERFGPETFTLHQHTEIIWIMCSCSLFLRCELDFAGMFSHLLNEKMSQPPHPECSGTFKGENLRWDLHVKCIFFFFSYFPDDHTHLMSRSDRLRFYLGSLGVKGVESVLNFFSAVIAQSGL